MAKVIPLTGTGSGAMRQTKSRSKKKNKPAAATSVPDGKRGFLDLPAEIRTKIYQYTLPYDQEIYFDRMLGNDGDQPQWKLRVTSSDSQGNSPPANTSPDTQVTHCENPVNTNLFLACKTCYAEAPAILFAKNTFRFTVDSASHRPDTSLRSLHTFARFGTSLHLPFLRDMSSIHLDVVAEHPPDHHKVRRMRARLEYFAEIICLYTNDKSRQSLLKKLHIQLKFLNHEIIACGKGHVFCELCKATESVMFCLEGLVALRDIEQFEVQVTGVDPWYARCVELYIQGKGGDANEAIWPKVRSRPRARLMCEGGTSLPAPKRKRQWHQPVFNWKEFAQRNDVELPGDIDRIFAGMED